jgi:uncharacterized protein (DUF433 family)
MTQVIQLPPELELGERTKVRKRKGARVYKGTPTIPDEVILKLRTRHEIDNVPLRKLLYEFPDLREQYIRDILDYRLRVHLRVKPI